MSLSKLRCKWDQCWSQQYRYYLTINLKHKDIGIDRASSERKRDGLSRKTVTCGSSSFLLVLFTLGFSVVGPTKHRVQWINVPDEYSGTSGNAKHLPWRGEWFKLPFSTDSGSCNTVYQDRCWVSSSLTPSFLPALFTSPYTWHNWTLVSPLSISRQVA